MEERLQNILAHRGVASRRHSAVIISEGRVTVDGIVCTEPGARFDPAKAVIRVDGRPLAASVEKQERLVPVGRLDKDSEGLILLSNDGDLSLKLTHPRYEHEKTYIVRAAGRWSEDKLDVLRGPVTMPDGYVTRPVPVEVLRKQENNVHLLLFKLKEGRKRQIRYMCSAAHLVVLSLKRVQISKLRLDENLKPGEWRDLTESELALLRN